MPTSLFLASLEHGSHAYFSHCNWRNLVSDLFDYSTTDLHREAFATQWVTNGAAIREQTQDDRLLVSFLRNWLPKYQGDDLILYRGESAERANNKQYGLCWTPNLKVATTFASGLNAVRPKGGVLLRSYAGRNAVITGPGRHSSYLQEYEHTVDPEKLTDIIIMEKFSPADRRPINA